MKINKEIPLN